MKNTNKKKLCMMIMLALLVVLLGEMVLGLGVGPSRKLITFAPGLEVEDELLIINDGRKDIQVGIYVEGKFQEYIEFEDTLVSVDKNSMITAVPYKLKFPTKAPEPGSHTLEIVIREFAGNDNPGATVKATVAVISEFIIKVPYPGKFATGKMFVSDAQDLDKPTLFTIMVQNFGEEDVEKVQGTVDVMSPTGDKIATVESNYKSIPAREEVRLDASWIKTVDKGSYIAKARVQYDDKKFELEQAFDIGTFTIELSDIKVEDFTLGDVAKFDISLSNNWNKRLDGVYAEITIDDSHGNEMTRFKTAAIDIEADAVGSLEGYWYTEDVMPGVYTVNVLIHYGNKMTKKVMPIEVDTNKVTFLGAGSGYAVSSEAKGETNTQNMLIFLIIIVVILLIAMNLLWFYFLTKKFKQRKED